MSPTFLSGSMSRIGGIAQKIGVGSSCMRNGGSTVLRALVRAAYRSDHSTARAKRNTRVQVLVRDNNVDQALKVLKKKMQREGVFREMKLRGHYEKPSERRVRERAEAIRRARKLARKKLQREGLLPMKRKVVADAAGRGGPPRGPRF
jgi:small subunit ribosomal protein S21